MAKHVLVVPASQETSPTASGSAEASYETRGGGGSPDICPASVVDSFHTVRRAAFFVMDSPLWRTSAALQRTV